jgi:phosphopantetheinyl transferase
VLPTLELHAASVERGVTLAVLAHRPAGVDRAAMWSQWQALVARFAGPHGAIVRTSAGKPQLVPAADLWFNVSYGKHWSLLALSRAGEIGCDVEDRLTADDSMRLDAVVLHPSESRHFASMPPRERSQAFARCWVRKEAILKAEGTGFIQDPRGVDTLDVRRWHLHERADAGVPVAVASRDAACAWFALQEPS